VFQILSDRTKWRQALSVLFLVLLLGGIVPWSALHQAMVKHTHSHLSAPGDHDDLSRPTVTCPCVHFVQHQKSFVHLSTPLFTAQVVEGHRTYAVRHFTFLYSSPNYFFSIQGPPAA